MSPIRRVVTSCEELSLELGAAVHTPVRRGAVAVAVRNPWAGRGVVADLRPEAEKLAPVLAREIADRLTAVLGGADAIASFGKAALVGLDGEAEHGDALIHTPYFGNVLRELLHGTSIIAFSEERAVAGTTATVPVWHKTEAATRSHYSATQIRVPDGPRPDELVITAAAATGPRPNARIGDRSTDPAVTLETLEGTR
ncbi:MULTISPECIES: amino acid synthesis family protein [Streptomyces]|uniref:Peptide synthetase n=1 Tax=Streptomyces cacaoi TaxID=1898 RepID=A0A4Y3QY06_STRCI|nr:MULTISPECIES: amino acid synthesis family protein [Streptomyces]NNG83614.1 amino acid synthesis family protein [Streptomyces cacaoi]QHF96556.1 peptide synthetase [Streptomyces sp. NHF165]GEB50052.1 peptide synthetase [Streptomyces cacaoi]